MRRQFHIKYKYENTKTKALVDGYDERRIYLMKSHFLSHDRIIKIYLVNHSQLQVIIYPYLSKIKHPFY